jgi:hypothetical protein
MDVTHEKEYEQQLARILGDVEQGAQRPRLAPRVGSYYRRAKTPYAAGRGRGYTIGTAWDELAE